jgi:hypothetical protein
MSVRNSGIINVWDKIYPRKGVFDFRDEFASKTIFKNLQQIIRNKESREPNVKAEFLKSHHQLGHLASSKMKKMKSK